MTSVVRRRYKRLKDENKSFPALVLVDGGLGQLHAAAEALEELGSVTQPLAAIAKREETIRDPRVQLFRDSSYVVGCGNVGARVVSNHLLHIGLPGFFRGMQHVPTLAIPCVAP